MHSYDTTMSTAPVRRCPLFFLAQSMKNDRLIHPGALFSLFLFHLHHDEGRDYPLFYVF